MKYKLIYQIGDQQETEYYPTPLDLESRYFVLSTIRHDGPSGIKIPSQLEGVIPSACFKMDKKWNGNREQDHERSHLWTVHSQEFRQPTEAQIRAVGKRIGSGRIIGMLAGITDREWRRKVSGERKISFTLWRILMELAGLVDALPVAETILRGGNPIESNSNH